MLFNEERLNREKHFELVGGFICGADDPLNLFLSGHSFDYDEQRYGHTYLFTMDDGELVSFYTIKANGIQSYSSSTNEYNSVPVVEIARFAVGHQFQRHGIGRKMFYESILRKVEQVSSLIAVKAIIVFVEPDNHNGILFYKSLGFVKAPENVQKEIGESFNENCELYVLQISDV